MDAERVLKTVMNKFQFKSKIGLFGRSIGGMTASHLAAKYTQLFSVLIVDRSLSEIKKVAESLSKGRSISCVFDAFSANGWICQNVENFHKAKCYKIMTIDPRDDLIDTFASIMVGVVTRHAK